MSWLFKVLKKKKGERKTPGRIHSNKKSDDVPTKSTFSKKKYRKNKKPKENEFEIQLPTSEASSFGSDYGGAYATNSCNNKPLPQRTSMLRMSGDRKSQQLTTKPSLTSFYGSFLDLERARLSSLGDLDSIPDSKSPSKLKKRGRTFSGASVGSSYSCSSSLRVVKNSDELFGDDNNNKEEKEGDSPSQDRRTERVLSQRDIVMNLEVVDKETFETLVDRIGNEESARICASISKACQDACDHTKNSVGEYTLLEALPTQAFVGDKIPSIPIVLYLCRLLRYMDYFSEEAPDPKSYGVKNLLLATLFIDRLSACQDEFYLSFQNIHRIYMVACLVAIKFTEDEVMSNKYWAAVGGVEVDVLNEMEMSFCELMGYDFVVTEEELSELYNTYFYDVKHDYYQELFE